MKCVTNAALPKSDPFRTVYIGWHNKRRYRVARDAYDAGWRLDKRMIGDLGPYEAANNTLYPTRDAAIDAFRALSGGQ